MIGVKCCFDFGWMLPTTEAFSTLGLSGVGWRRRPWNDVDQASSSFITYIVAN